MEFTYYDSNTNQQLTSVNGMIKYCNSLEKKLFIVKKLMFKLYGVYVSFNENYTYKNSYCNSNVVINSSFNTGYSGRVSNDFEIHELQYSPIFSKSGVIVNDSEKIECRKRLKELLKYLLVGTYSPYILSTSSYYPPNDEFTIPVGLVKIGQNNFDNARYEYEKIKEERWYDKLLSLVS